MIARAQSPRTVEELMVAEPIGIEPDDPIELAESVLALAHARHWPVAHARDLVGMVSLDDLVEALGAEHGRVRAGELMCSAQVFAHPGDELCAAAERMRRHRLSCLPVVDGGELLGVVTRDDLLRFAAYELEAEGEASGAAIEVAHLMTRAPVATIGPVQTLEVATLKMRMLEVRHLPVTRGGVVLGMLAERDVRRARRDREEALEAILVCEVMTAAPATVAPHTDAVAAAHLLLDRAIGALPVIEDRRLTGILTRDDFLRHLGGACVEVRIDR